MGTSDPATDHLPWYRGVTRAQWLVLAVASAGWVFDVFEGQIFIALKDQMLQALVSPADKELAFNVCLIAFLVGGALGGIVFGMLADRWGRRRTMALTILMYSAFTGLTYFAEDVWQVALLRFLVGMGVGGEWAVAAAAVAEVFSARSRPAAAGIFHASSVFGTFLAVGAGALISQAPSDDGWRYGFLLGLVPAVLVAWVRFGMHESASWQLARSRADDDARQRLGRLRDLFSAPELRRHTLIATGLAVIGLATFWGAHIRAQDLLRDAKKSEQMALEPALRDRLLPRQYFLAGMFLNTVGGSLGLLSFAPISQRLGRRGAFLLFHLAGFIMVLLTTWQAYSVDALVVLLPVFGFFTLGMHAGYAVYFPELFPTRLRGTGAGFCFNTARLVAGPVLLGFAYLQDKGLGLGLPTAMLALGSLYLVGAVLVLFAPETRGLPLPD